MRLASEELKLKAAEAKMGVVMELYAWSGGTPA